MVLDDILDESFAAARGWHYSGKELFEWAGGSDHVKLIYHNYQIWHCIEGYKSSDENKVIFVYEGGNLHNRFRNESIEKLDDQFCLAQKGVGPYNSETLGSLVDRIGINYIKLMHLEEYGDRRVGMTKSQIDLLVHCARELYSDMLAGRRQCFQLSRFKIYDKFMPETG